MNKLSVFVFSSIMLVSIQANAADICGIPITDAKSVEEARQSARASLAERINARISLQSTTKQTISGTESEQRDTTIQQITSELLNAQDIKYNDKVSSTACMSSEDAARPYLYESKKLTSELDNTVYDLKRNPCDKKEYWEKVNTIYRELKKLESVLTSLGQIETALKKNYDDNYYEAKKEYDLFMQPKGVFVESTDPYFQNKIISFLYEYGCVIIAEECKTYALHLKLNVKHKTQEDRMNNSYCNASIDINLSDKKGYEIYKHSFIGDKIGWTDREIACEKAMDSAAKETWKKIKGKINRGDCK